MADQQVNRFGGTAFPERLKDMGGGLWALVTATPPGAAVVSAATMTRPTDTTAYASGDLVANNVTAGSVTPLSFAGLAVTAGDAIGVVGLRAKKSTTTLTNAQFRLHLFNVLPVLSVGDNVAFDTSGALGVTDAAGYIGYIDFTFDTSGTASAAARGVPTSPAADKILAAPASGGLWGLLEARAAYAPGNAETFDISLHVVR